MEASDSLDRPFSMPVGRPAASMRRCSEALSDEGRDVARPFEVADVSEVESTVEVEVVDMRVAGFEVTSTGVVVLANPALALSADNVESRSRAPFSPRRKYSDVTTSISWEEASSEPADAAPDDNDEMEGFLAGTVGFGEHSTFAGLVGGGR